MAATSRPVYQFGPFALHAAMRLLFRGNAVVPLTSKTFETLLALVQHAGRVVGKDELLARVWPGAIVEESNLTQTVFVLRKALGETPRDHRYIATVPKRGYCFVAEVRETSADPRAEPAAGPPGPVAGRRDTEGADVHQLCLKGRHFWEKRTAGAVEKAIRCFQEALERDPASARAYAGLADCYAIVSHYSKLSPAQTLPRARAAALKALEIDDARVEAHASLGLVKMLYDWDWAGAEASFLHALERDDRYATAHHWYGLYLAARGQFDKALVEIGRAEELDPLSLPVNTDLALVLYLARRYDEALTQYRVAIDLDATFADAQEGILMASNAMGMYCQPISEFTRFPESFSRDVAATLEAAYQQAGVTGYWRAYLQLADSPSAEVRSSPYVRARIYARLGEPEQALRWLEAAYSGKDGGLSLLKVDPGMDALRGEARFAAILGRIGLA